MIGQKLAHFKITSKLGAGGMGEVYLAEDTRLGRQVAIKLLPEHVTESPSSRDRFEREARTLAALDHPNIASIYSFESSADQSETTHFIVMQRVAGTSLREALDRGRLSTRRWLEIAIAVAEGLSHAHEKGIVHRDLKPENVMLTDDEQVRLVDFGIAKLIDESTRSDDLRQDFDSDLPTLEAGLTAQGAALGTVAYMSPEQARGNQVDARTDLFSLGVMLYEMASGRRPFEGKSDIDSLTATLHSTPQPLGQHDTRIPQETDRIVRKLLEKEPDRRYQHASDLIADLRNLKRDLKTEDRDLVPRSAGTLSGSWSTKGFGRVAAAIVGLMVLAAALAIVVQIGRGPVADDAPSGPRSIAILGFEHLTDPSDPRQVGRMLMGLITTDLAESGGVSVISTPRVLAALRRFSSDSQRSFDPAVADRAAMATGADLMMVGQIGQVDDSLMLTAELIDVYTGQTTGSFRQEATSESDLFALAGSIASGIRSKIGLEDQSGQRPDFDLAEALTDNPEAYRHFTLGETALHRFEVDDAIEHFNAAIEADPSFALAYLRGAIAMTWHSDASPHALLEQGIPYIDRLPSRWQSTYRAYLDFRYSQHAEAWETLDPITRENAPIPDAYYIQGEIASHTSHYYDPKMSRALFERALDIDPRYRVVLFHLADSYVMGRDFAAAERLFRPYLDDDPDDPLVLDHYALIQAARGEMDPAIATLESLIDTDYVRRLRLITIYTASWQWDRVPEVVDRTSNLEVAYAGAALIGSGRFDEGIETIRRSVERGREFPQLNADFLRWIALCLEAAGRLEEALATSVNAIEVDPDWTASIYTQGRILLAMNRLDDAEATLEVLSETANRVMTPLAQFWEFLLQAEIELASGDLEAVDKTLHRISALAQEHRQPVAELLSTARYRAASGDDDGALDAYRQLIRPEMNLPWPEIISPIVGLYELGELEAKLGNHDQAARHLGRFLDNWGETGIPIAQQAQRLLDDLAAP